MGAFDDVADELERKSSAPPTLDTPGAHAFDRLAGLYEGEQGGTVPTAAGQVTPGGFGTQIGQDLRSAALGALQKIGAFTQRPVALGGTGALERDIAGAITSPTGGEPQTGLGMLAGAVAHPQEALKRTALGAAQLGNIFATPIARAFGEAGVPTDPDIGYKRELAAMRGEAEPAGAETLPWPERVRALGEGTLLAAYPGEAFAAQIATNPQSIYQDPTAALFALHALKARMGFEPTPGVTAEPRIPSGTVLPLEAATAIQQAPPAGPWALPSMVGQGTTQGHDPAARRQALIREAETLKNEASQGKFTPNQGQEIISRLKTIRDELRAMPAGQIEAPRQAQPPPAPPEPRPALAPENLLESQAPERPRGLQYGEMPDFIEQKDRAEVKQVFRANDIGEQQRKRIMGDGPDKWKRAAWQFYQLTGRLPGEPEPILGEPVPPTEIPPERGLPVQDLRPNQMRRGREFVQPAVEPAPPVPEEPATPTVSMMATPEPPPGIPPAGGGTVEVPRGTLEAAPAETFKIRKPKALGSGNLGRGLMPENPRAEPNKVASYIRSRGGIWDPAMSGEMRILRDTHAGILNKKTGKSLDGWAEALHEEFPDTWHSRDDAFEWLRDEFIYGKRQHSSTGGTFEEYQAGKERKIRSRAEQLGVDPERAVEAAGQQPGEIDETEIAPGDVIAHAGDLYRAKPAERGVVLEDGGRIDLKPGETLSGTHVERVEPPGGEVPEFEAPAKVQTFDEFSAERGVSATPPQAPELHRVPGGVSKPTAKAASDRLARELADWYNRRGALRKEYDAAVNRGDIRASTRQEDLARAAAKEGAAGEAARRVLAKQTERTLPGEGFEEAAARKAQGQAAEATERKVETKRRQDVQAGQGSLIDEQTNAAVEERRQVAEARASDEARQGRLISDEQYQKDLALLKDELSGKKLHSFPGPVVDPKVLAAVMRVGVYHIENAIRTGVALTKEAWKRATAKSLKEAGIDVSPTYIDRLWSHPEIRRVREAKGEQAPLFRQSIADTGKPRPRRKRTASDFELSRVEVPPEGLPLAPVEHAILSRGGKPFDEARARLLGQPKITAEDFAKLNPEEKLVHVTRRIMDAKDPAHIAGIMGTPKFGIVDWPKEDQRAVAATIARRMMRAQPETMPPSVREAVKGAEPKEVGVPQLATRLPGRRVLVTTEPERALRQAGKTKLNIVEPIRQANKQIKKELNSWNDILSQEWKTPDGKPIEEGDRNDDIIANLIDNREGDKAWLDRAEVTLNDGSKAKVEDWQREIAKGIVSLNDDLADRQELPAFGRQKNYMTHFMDRTGVRFEKASDAAVAKLHKAAKIRLGDEYDAEKFSSLLPADLTRSKAMQLMDMLTSERGPKGWKEVKRRADIITAAGDVSALPKDLYQPYLKERKGAPFKVSIVQWKRVYLPYALRKIWLEPAVHAVRPMIEALPDVGRFGPIVSQHQYAERYVGENLGHATAADKFTDAAMESFALTNTGQWMQKLPVVKHMFAPLFKPRLASRTAVRLNALQYMRLLGGAADSLIQNLTQGVNTLAEGGFKATGRGYGGALNPRNWGKLRREKLLQDFEGFYKDERGALGKAAGVANKAIFANMSVSEEINRGAAFLAGLADAKTRGMSFEQGLRYANGKVSKLMERTHPEKFRETYFTSPAEEHARKMVRTTQFDYSAAGSSPYLRSPSGRFFGQFTNYPSRQASFLLDGLRDPRQTGDYWKFVRFAALVGGSLYGGKKIGETLGVDLSGMWSLWGLLPHGLAPNPALALNVVGAASGEWTSKEWLKQQYPLEMDWWLSQFGDDTPNSKGFTERGDALARLKKRDDEGLLPYGLEDLFRAGHKLKAKEFPWNVLPARPIEEQPKAAAGASPRHAPHAPHAPRPHR